MADVQNVGNVAAGVTVERGVRLVAWNARRVACAATVAAEASPEPQIRCSEPVGSYRVGGRGSPYLLVRARSLHPGGIQAFPANCGWLG